MGGRTSAGGGGGGGVSGGAVTPTDVGEASYELKSLDRMLTASIKSGTNGTGPYGYHYPTPGDTAIRTAKQIRGFRDSEVGRRVTTPADRKALTKTASETEKLGKMANRMTKSRKPFDHDAYKAQMLKIKAPQTGMDTVRDSIRARNLPRPSSAEMGRINRRHGEPA